MSERFTEKAERALNNSVKTAEKLGHTYIGSEHLLLSLSEDEYSCASLILKKNGVSKNMICGFIKEYSGTGLKSNLSSKDLTPRARKILESSYNNANQHGDGTIGTEHILLAILDERDCVASKIFKNISADVNAIRSDIYTLIKSREKTIKRTKKDAYAPILKQYGKNLCELARENKFDPVIGRDRETDRIIRILSRKNKNNPCLIGEAGVGKTAIVEGLAERIANNDVPPALIGKTIISLDLTSMVAGAKYRGDFEERIKNIINEVVKQKDIILFIDEIHTIVGAGAAEGAIDASNILKPQLARGDVQIIGATTYEEYRRYIEKDAALERRFQPVPINEPTASETTSMLRAIKSRYEEHHGVEIDDAAIEECVILSKKYINDRFLPDKAIDILDEACALMRSKSNNMLKTAENAKQLLEIDNQEHSAGIDIVKFYEAEYPVRIPQIHAPEKPKITVEIIKEIISEMCQIPISIIRKNINYEELESNLNKAVVGQRDAVSTLVSAIKRADLGFSGTDRPRGIFLFIGESGVGKTALAVELEKNLFFTSSNLLRFDMSEYSEKQSISKLIGSPPGYVGHSEGGTLTEAVRKRPNSVILFDEIEKADKEILNILLQISDYGYLRDSLGKSISFRNTIIIATSNIGASRRENLGFENTNAQSVKASQADALKKYYTREFINRFDEIIYFSSLDESTLKEIVSQNLNKLSSSLSEKGYEFTFGDDVISVITEKSSNNGMGARPALRLISSKIEDKIIDLLINDESTKAISASVIDGEIKIHSKNALKT